MVNFEEKKIENGFVTIFDEDGLITIQMKQEQVIKIMDYFTPFIERYEDKIEFFDFDGYVVELRLSNNNVFGSKYVIIYGRRYLDKNDPDGSYMHDFEIEECFIEDWYVIYNFIKNN